MEMGDDPMSAKKCKKAKSEGAPAWMVTYSDMVTLLLTFFVLMLSMSEMDKVKFMQAAGSLRGAFGVMESKSKNDVDSQMVLPRFEAIPYEMVQSTYTRMVQQLDKLKLNRNIELVKDRGAIVLRVNEQILFDSGSDKLKPEAGSVLREVADLIKPLPFEVRIEGHADGTPFSGPGLSNWDLSVQRAVAVLKYFAGNDLLPLERLSAVGYGDRKPLVPNDTVENRALNRRVEFVLEAGGDYRQPLPYLIDTGKQLPF